MIPGPLRATSRARSAKIPTGASLTIARVSAWMISRTPSTTFFTASTPGPLRRVRKTPKRIAKTITGNTSPAAIAARMLSGTIRRRNSGRVCVAVENPSGSSLVLPRSRWVPGRMRLTRVSPTVIARVVVIV